MKLYDEVNVVIVDIFLTSLNRHRWKAIDTKISKPLVLLGIAFRTI
jgi:hypothetical protein